QSPWIALDGFLARTFRPAVTITAGPVLDSPNVLAVNGKISFRPLPRQSVIRLTDLRCGCDMKRSKSEVRELLVRLLSEITEIPRESIREGATIDADLQMESVAFVELNVAIEDELNIRVDPIAIVELNEFSAIVDYVVELTAGQPA